MQLLITPLAKLTEQFQKLPGIGQKTAQRLAFYILSLSKEEAKDFADAIVNAKNTITNCPICQNITDSEVCPVCRNDKRDKTVVCVVETPQDVIAFEKMREYKGVYHVLHGVISPMDGIGPDDLKVRELLARVSEGDINEIIMATNPTIEGEATALYLSKLLKPIGIKVTRIAYGIPVGGDLEYADEITLLRAFEGRREF